ncbi:MAG: hypothetical protein ACOCUU_00545 [Nanoarchaeota archaeon]
MKIQKQLSKKRNGKNYYKYVIVIPEKNLAKANFKESDELEAFSETGKIVLCKK